MSETKMYEYFGQHPKWYSPKMYEWTIFSKRLYMYSPEMYEIVVRKAGLVTTKV
jgi:hypothetical protein